MRWWSLLPFGNQKWQSTIAYLLIMCPLKHQCIEDVQLELLITGGYCDIIINVITIIILLLLLLLLLSLQITIITIMTNYYYYYYHYKLLLSLQIITIIAILLPLLLSLLLLIWLLLSLLSLFLYIYIYSNPQNKCQFQCVHSTSMVPVGCSTALILWYPVYPFERVTLANPIKLPPKKREKHVWNAGTFV